MADRPDTAARRDDTRDPHASRMAALRVLYAADVRGIDPLDVLQEELESGPSDDAELGAAPMDRFAMTLLHGLAASIPEHDARIARFARGWRLERMPAIDRNVLRLAVHELLTEPTPVPVVIDEAVRLASELSTDDSGRYVNGVLSAIVRELAEQASDTSQVAPEDEAPALRDETAPEGEIKA